MMIPFTIVDGILSPLYGNEGAPTKRYDDDNIHDTDMEERPFLRRRYDLVPTEDEEAKWETQNGFDCTSDLFLVTTYAKQVRRIVEQTLLYRQTQRSTCRKDYKNDRDSP